MSLNDELNIFYKQVGELRKIISSKQSVDFLSQDIISLNDVCGNATFHINKTCLYLNSCTDETLKGRYSALTISVGKENAPLMVSLKQLSDKIYNTELDGSIDVEEHIHHNLSIAEDNFHSLEDQIKSNNRFIQSLDCLVRHFRKQDKLDRNLSTVSELCSFSEEDFVSSSPINSLLGKFLK